ncbi:hypothetical protein GQX74_015602 [Glossina fuscipes]|nr:hypothetical protein GQX74_015602 [Glossina fuscipes]
MLLIKTIYAKIVEYERENMDPRTADIPVASSLKYTFALIGIYLLIVLKLGPALMSNRKPFEIKRILQIYNILQIVGNLYLLYQVRICICIDLYNNLRKVSLKIIFGFVDGSSTQYSSKILTISAI